MIKSFFLAFFLFSGLLLSTSASATLDKDLWPEWSVSNPLSTKTISHKEWQSFLDEHLITNNENINLVDYKHITPEDLHHLKHYIDTMSSINVLDYNRNEQLAYWINLYNAITVHIIASYYPVTSIEEINISPGLFSVGPWGAKLVTVNGLQLSLEDIHSRIIRPIWNDNRTHYAINNGAIGAPNLSKQAYSAAKLDAQLNQAASDYINSLRGVQIIEGELVTAKIYEWFVEDFGDNQKHVIHHLSQFAKEPLKSQLKKTTMINSYFYNWHLNGAQTKNY